MSFHFKQFSILHQTEGLKVNTDGCLLGALAQAESPQHCLDIGTGTGVIALMLAQKYPEAMVTAVELNPLAFLQAQHNIEASPFSERIQTINTDILQLETRILYDLIVCNPPYFKQHLKGMDEHRNMALHNDHLPQDKLMHKVGQLLSEDGVFMAIYPPHEMKILESLAETHNFKVQQRILVHNKAGNHHRTVIALGRKTSIVKESVLVLINAEGGRTDEFSKIMADYYL